MKKKISKSLLMTALITGMCIGGAQGAFAADDLQEFTLDPMIVTATRTEKRDLDVPATTSIYTSKQLADTGATTLEGALKYATGVVYKSETIGDGGGEFLIRGKRRGTLMLVDGVPLNVRTGYYDLDAINIDDIERIEVVRGGGAVLYGSDASGGVINIITKDKKSNSIVVSGGNYGVQKYQTSLQLGKLGIGASWDKKGPVDKISNATSDGVCFNFYGGEKTILNMNYKFNDNLKITADYNNYDYTRGYIFEATELPYDKRFINREEYKVVVNYEQDGWKADAYYHKGSSDSRYHYWGNEYKYDRLYANAYSYGHTDEIKGLDITKEFNFKNDTLLVGAKMYNESYDYYNGYSKEYKEAFGKSKYYNYDYNRNVYSVFAQLEHNFDEKNDMIIGARETWTGSSPDGTNYSEFTPQIQYLHKVSDDLSAYASVAKSFTMPTMNDMYGKGEVIKNSEIKPEVGMHYEAGLKHISGDHSWKLAVFKSDVENFITTTSKKIDGVTQDVAINEDTKNMGIELSGEVVSKNGFSAHWGISYSDPQYRSEKEDGGIWKRNYGRWLLNGGLNYQQDKFNISLNGSYMADRVMQKYQEDIKPYFYTSLHASYKPTKDHEIFLNVDNLLDREDITSHVSSRYKSLGTNFVLGYKYKF